MRFNVNEQSNVLNDYIMCLLHGVTAAHVHHLNSVSYAEHIALNEFYEGLEDLTDKLAEACLQRKSQNISSLKPYFSGENGLALVNQLFDETNLMRKMDGFPQETEIQNIVDEIADLCRSTIYKLTRFK